MTLSIVSTTGAPYSDFAHMLQAVKRNGLGRLGKEKPSAAALRLHSE